MPSSDPQDPNASHSAWHAIAFVLCVSLSLGVFAQSPSTLSAYQPEPPIPLRLQEFFQMPVGPQGLVLSERLRSANGRLVRLTGYVVRQEVATPGHFLLAPRPVQMSQHADGEADDLPPATVLVRLATDQQDWAVAHASGLVEVTGTLELGRKEESDGRVSWFRLQLTPEAIRGMTPIEMTQHLPSQQHGH
jgi:hypothetical protein